jgi:hypothetical protein
MNEPIELHVIFYFLNIYNLKVSKKSETSKTTNPVRGIPCTGKKRNT